MRGFLTRFRNCVRRRLTQAMSDQNIFAAALDKIRAANTALIKDGALPFGIDQSRIVVEPPRESAHGDMATNAAMVLAKDAGAKPRVLAEAIAAKLRSDDLVAKAEVAGPGFINLTLKPKAWIGALRAVLAAGANYGRSNVGGGSVVNVEYVSANPTGPMHVGHCRGAVFGDALALKVVHDVFFSERSLLEGPRDQVSELIAVLRRAGYVYEGRLPPPKGAPVEDWEDREQTLFRATAFDDDVDRPLMKSDGSYTYFAFDIAYHKNKVDRGFRSMIDVWGADHGGYVKRVQAAVSAVRAITNTPTADLDVKIVQLVKLLRAGEPVKMSKRAGEFVTLREVVDEVGKDAVRFMMLYRKNDAVLDFDFVKVQEQSRDNPVFYVQYGHARGQSVLRNARECVPDLPAEAAARAAVLARAPLERLDDPGEIGLMRRLALYPRLVEAAAMAHEPRRIAFYLY